MLPDAESQAAEASTDVTGDGDAVLTGQLNPRVVPPSLGGRQVPIQTALPGQGVAVQSVGLWARQGLGQSPQGTRVWTWQEKCPGDLPTPLLQAHLQAGVQGKDGVVQPHGQ